MRLTHYSTQFHRQPAVLDRAIDGLIAPSLTAPLAPNVLTLTEVGNSDRAAVLPRPGWSVTQVTDQGAKAADAAILTRDASLTVIGYRYWHVYDRRFISMRGRWVDGWWAVAVVVEGPGVERTVITAGHPPAHLVTPGRRRASREGITQWGKHSRAFAAKVGATRVVVAADWNLNLTRHRTRAQLERAFKGFRLVVPPDPTLRRRTIDGAMVRDMDPALVQVLPAGPASDHRPVRFLFRAR